MAADFKISLDPELGTFPPCSLLAQSGSWAGAAAEQEREEKLTRARECGSEGAREQ